MDYALPQYVAIFYNLDRPALKDKNLRLGLQLGTNKQDIVNSIGESEIVDTPLLEINNDDWEYKFDEESAQGALFESEWYFPEKLRLQRLLEQREANQTGLLKADPVMFLNTGAVLTMSGPANGMSGKDKINGIPLKQHPTQTGSWIVEIPMDNSGTGGLKRGINLIRLTDDKGRTVDSIYVNRTTDAIEYQRATNEQKLVELFVQSRDGKVPEAQRIAVKDLFMDEGYLRRRTEKDPIGVRTNNRGDKLTLTLLTSPTPANHPAVANVIKEQWAKLGVEIALVIPETRSEFEEKLLRRDYDLLLFGQSLLDNLDSYPYWHSSGVQQVTENRNDLRLDAYNLSQYASFEADALLETIRGRTGDAERTEALKKLEDVLKKDVPAVFLYSPRYTYAYREDMKGIELGHLSLHSDRFLTLYRWYTHQDRIFKAGKGWLSFFGWMSSFFQPDEPPENV
jgi:hypothetical protein